MKRIISVIVVIAMMLGSMASVFADDSVKKDSISLSKEELQEKIDYLNNKFPDANLNIEDFDKLDNKLSGMSDDERMEYLINTMNSEPEKVYYHEDEYGVDSTLSIMSSGFWIYYDRTLGSVYHGNTFVSYTNTLVYLDVAIGYSFHALSYNVDHEINYDDYSGYVTWSGNLISHNQSIYAITNAHMFRSTGSDVHALATIVANQTTRSSAITTDPCVALHFKADDMSVYVN